MIRIVYIFYIPLSEKIENDFYLQELIKDGFDVEYWDVSTLFFKQSGSNSYIKRDYLKTFVSISDLRISLEKVDNKNTLFIPQMTFEWRVLRLFRLLTSQNCRLAFFSRGALPMPQISLRIRSMYRLSINQVLTKVLNRLRGLLLTAYKGTGWIKPMDYLMIAGRHGIQSVGYGHSVEKKHSVIIQVNSFDYDNYLLTRYVPSPLPDLKYCVFLDEDLPFHPDWKMFNNDSVDPDKYYQILNAFFKAIEDYLHISVVVAAHPKSDYRANPFNGRVIMKFKTNELVKHSEFAMAHMSSSINFAVLHEKPLLFLVTNEYVEKFRSSVYLRTVQSSSILNCKIVNCEEFNLAELDNYGFDPESYKKYKYDYLTSPESEHKTTYEIYSEFLKSL